MSVNVDYQQTETVNKYSGFRNVKNNIYFLLKLLISKKILSFFMVPLLDGYYKFSDIVARGLPVNNKAF